MLPTMYTVWPKLVARRSLKVTVVRVGVVQGPLELVVVDEEGEEVREGQAVFVAELQGPVAEPREQEVGRRAWGECLLVEAGLESL
jgi:hypothetical protein